jgi:hypothetical protein
VISTRGDDERPLGELLAAHVGEVDLVAVEPGEQLLHVGGDVQRLQRHLAAEVQVVGQPDLAERPLP